MQLRARRRIHDEEEAYGSRDATEVARSRPLMRWVHMISVMVILCFIILRWLSRPDRVGVKDGRIESVLHTKIPREFENYFRTNHTLVEDATSPVTSNFSGFANNNEDEASTGSTWTLRSPTDPKPTGNGSLAPNITFLEFPGELYD